MNQISELRKALNKGDYQSALEIGNELYTIEFRLYQEIIGTRKLLESHRGKMSRKDYDAITDRCQSSIMQTQKRLQIYLELGQIFASHNQQNSQEGK